MASIAVQYLEGLSDVQPQKARDKLCRAFDKLPITMVLLGWNLPDSLLNVCADECNQRQVPLYRWQPLLTSDGEFMPKTEWHTVGLNHEPVQGFEGLPEFTFACPNNPDVQEAVCNRTREVIQGSPYDGIFLDRIRFPSPFASPERQLACFCVHCREKAAKEGLDLESVRISIINLLSDRKGIASFVRVLFGVDEEPLANTDCEMLASFLAFRMRSVSRLIKEVAGDVHDRGLKVGLDCFSPVLTTAVGQDLAELGGCSEWIKIMSYAHTFGVAGLPFELINCADWLMQQKGFHESEALQLLSEATRLPFPASKKDIRKTGFSSEVLALETERALQAGINNCLPGIELVDEDDLTSLSPTQITADLHAFKDAGAGGLVLSWDLWYIPEERLDLVKGVWGDTV